MYKVLIVDDENIIRIGLQTIIDWRMYDFEVAGAVSNGEEALEFMKNEQVDLLVTDLNMPIMDGIELIQKLKEQNYEGRILILSNYDDFKLVRKGMLLGAEDYLLKFSLNSEQIREVLINVKEKIKERKSKKEENEELKAHKRVSMALQWKSLMNGELSGLIQGEETLHKHEKKHFLFYNILIEDEEHQLEKEEERKQLFCGISNIVKELFEAQEDLSIVKMQDEMVVLISQTAEENEKDIRARAEQIQNLLKLYMNLETSIVYSSYFETPKVIHELYKEALETLKNRFYLESTYLGKIQQINWSSEKVDLKKYTEELYKLIQKQDRKGCRTIIDELKNIYMKKKIHPSVFKEDVINMTLTLEEDDDLKLFYEKIQSAFTYKQMLNVLRQAILYCLNNQEKNYAKVYREEVAEVLEYIDENIERKFSIADAARLVNVSESYLCTIFKDQVGKSLISYVNERKMCKAAEIIAQSELLLKEVAYKVGITDPFYFNRLFKKYYGVSPSKYKELRNAK